MHSATVAMKSQFIRKHDEQHSIEKMCQSMTVSRGGYNAWHGSGTGRA